LAERLENAGERLLSDRLVDDDPEGAARAVLNDIRNARVGCAKINPEHWFRLHH
jgi:hypothetical protein